MSQAAATRATSVGFAEEMVPAGTHICYLFGDEDERQEMLVRYFNAGQSAGEKGLLLVDNEEPTVMANKLSARGLAPGDGFSAVHVRDYYYEGGIFAPERMLDHVRTFFEEAMSAGFAGARGSGDMSWAWRAITGADRVMEYEALLGIQLARYPATCVCQYDVRLFSGAQLMDVLSVHPYTLLRGQLIKNPYSIGPAQFLERYRAARS
jgi:hypothetical protein